MGFSLAMYLAAIAAAAIQASAWELYVSNLQLCGGVPSSSVVYYNGTEVPTNCIQIGAPVPANGDEFCSYNGHEACNGQFKSPVQSFYAPHGSCAIFSDDKCGNKVADLTSSCNNTALAEGSYVKCTYDLRPHIENGYLSNQEKNKDPGH